MAEETNFFSKDNNTLILDCSSESKSCVCSNILNNDKKVNLRNLNKYYTIST